MAKRRLRRASRNKELRPTRLAAGSQNASAQMDNAATSHGYRDSDKKEPSKYHAVPWTRSRSFSLSARAKKPSARRAKKNDEARGGARRTRRSLHSSTAQHAASGSASARATGTARHVRWRSSGNAVTTRNTVRNPGKACQAARTSSLGVSVEGGGGLGAGSVATGTAPLGADARGTWGRSASSRRPEVLRSRSRIRRGAGAPAARACARGGVASWNPRASRTSHTRTRGGVKTDETKCVFACLRISGPLEKRTHLFRANSRFARTAAGTTRARSPRVARVARPRAFASFPAR